MGAEHNGPAWLVNMVSLLSGRAAATFVILAGIGISLLSSKARISNNRVELRSNRITLLKRALFLFVVGLLYTPIWPADILHFYGIYIAVAAFLLASSSRKLLVYSGLLVFGFLVMIFTLDYGQGWNWETLNYNDFWKPAGMIRHLFFNGFHPVIPWLAFLLVGMVIGRLDLNKPDIRKKLLIIGGSVALVAEVSSRLLISVLTENSNAVDSETIVAIFGTGPMPPMPLYMLAGAGSGIVVIVLMVILGRKFGDSIWLRPFVSTGQLALTLYVAHVIIGMGVLESIGKLENQTLPVSLLASAVFCTVSVVYAHYWRKRFKRGPVEAFMRYLT